MPTATLTFSLSPGAAEIQLTPAGPAFRADDASGRPADVAAWKIDKTIAERLKARLAARKNPAVIDYEHQTILASENGQPAPAAGWFETLEWREGKGLFATGVQWTAKAAAMIASGEYRFISPVFTYDARGANPGEITAIRMAALTNNPALDGMAAVALSAALSRLTPLKGTEMELKTLLAALALPETGTEAEALSALAALKEKAEGAATELAALKAKEPELALLAAEHKRVVETLAALEKEKEDERVKREVEAALTARKIAPANREAAEAFCRAKPELFAKWVKDSPALLSAGESGTKNQPADTNAKHPLLRDLEARFASGTGAGSSSRAKAA